MRTMNRHATIRWGIAGTGYMASRFAAELAHVPDAAIAAVGSRDAGRAAALAQRCGASRAHGSYAALFADPEVDIVYVATPNTTHGELCLQALAAGRAVLCEKPFTCTAAEAREVAARARAQRLFCMEGLWTRFLPTVQEAARLCAAGAIGEVESFVSHLGWPHAVDPGARLFDAAQGGGALMDLGVYTISLARLFLGPIIGVAGRVRQTSTGVDGSAAMTLTHTGERLASLTASLVATSINTAAVLGSRGRLVMSAAAIHRELRLERDGVVGDPTAGSDSTTFSLPAIGNGYAHEAVEAMRCLRAGLTESPTMPLDETIEVLEVIDRVRGSRA